MCVIVVSEKKMEEKIIKKCWESNPNGAGYSICNDTNVFFRRGIMKYEEFLYYYNRDIKDGVKHVLHFRIPSAGDRSEAMTHPFPLDKGYLDRIRNDSKNKIISRSIIKQDKSGYAKATLSHNGTIFSLGIGNLSDSFCAAYILSNIQDASAYPDILKMLDDRSRFVVALPDRVDMVGDFEEENGIYYSNMYWQDRYMYTGAKRYYSWLRSEDDDYEDSVKTGNITDVADTPVCSCDKNIYCPILETEINRAECINCIDSTEYLCEMNNK